MKVLIKLLHRMPFLGLLLALGASAHAQGGNTITIAFPGVPSGSCSFVMTGLNAANGDYYDCLTGAWFKINGGGGGVPAGATTNVQYNNAGAFGGNAGFTYNGTNAVTVGVAGSGNGVLTLGGNTSGTATFTAPAVAGTTTNAVASSNVLSTPAGSGTNVAYGVAGTPANGMWFSGVDVVLNATRVFLQSSGTSMANTNASGFTVGAGVFGGSTAIGSANDVGISRLDKAIMAAGTGATTGV